MVQIDTIKKENITRININGDVDASSSIQLDESLGAVIRAGELKILVNCMALNYISSAGLGVFMSYIEEIKKKEISMALFGLNEKVKNVFDILGLDQLLTIVDSENEALAAVNEE